MFWCSRRSEGCALHLGEWHSRFPAWLCQEPPGCPYLPACVADFRMSPSFASVNFSVSRAARSSTLFSAFGPASARQNFLHAQTLDVPGLVKGPTLTASATLRRCDLPRGLGPPRVNRRRSNPAACLEPSSGCQRKSLHGFKISFSLESLLGRTQLNARGPQTTVFHFNVFPKNEVQRKYA